MGFVDIEDSPRFADRVEKHKQGYNQVTQKQGKIKQIAHLLLIQNPLLRILLLVNILIDNFPRNQQLRQLLPPSAETGGSIQHEIFCFFAQQGEQGMEWEVYC